MSQGLTVRVLGSGTSLGVPVIGCNCPVCQSPDPKNQRTRASILLSTDQGLNIVIDTGPDFRSQLIREHIKTVDAVLYTHTHADHCHGLDDLRVFYFRQNKIVPCFIGVDHVEDLKSRFSYVFRTTGYDGTKPQVDLRVLNEDIFTFEGLEFETIKLPHGHMQTLAFRLGEFAYATDFKYFPEEAVDRWRGKVRTMIASGLRYEEHPTHSSISETTKLFRRLKVEKGFLTHLSHDVEYHEGSKKLPQGMGLAYDGLLIYV